MNKLKLGLGAASGLALCIACSGATSADGPADGGASSSSSSSGASGASGGEPATCTEFAVGAPVGPEIGGSIESRVIANAVSELAKSSAAVREDLTAQCKELATSLDAPLADRSTADAITAPREKQTAWCALAVAAISSQKAKAGGSLKVQFAPASCRLKVADKTACQSECAGGAACDAKANPSKCTGGTLFVACEGDCTAQIGAPLFCEGSCTGTCQGTCNGTLTAESPASCNGACDGRCSTACKGSPGAPVQCSGKCAGDSTAVDCRGGRLEGGCKVEAKCDRACDMRVTVKASCPAPVLAVTVSVPTDPAAAALLKSTLEAVLPKVIAIKTRVELEAHIGASFLGIVSAVADVKSACVAPIIRASHEANDDITATTSASSSVVASVQ